MGFSRHEYWSGFPCPPPGDLPKPGIKPRFFTLHTDSLLSEPWGKPWWVCRRNIWPTESINWGRNEIHPHKSSWRIRSGPEGIKLSEISQTKTNTVWSHMWNLTTSNQKQTKPIDTEYRPVVARGEGQNDDHGQKVYTSSYEIKVMKTQRIAWWLEWLTLHGIFESCFF